MSTALELVPLCTVDLTLGPPQIIGNGPRGMRMIVDITAMVFVGERLNGTARSGAADWFTVAGDVATIDVRATIETDDGALVYVQYQGRSDASAGVGSAPIYVAPVFETGDPRYSWLNHIQAVGRGRLADLRYEWYELR